MALIGIDYNTRIKDIPWDDATSGPREVTNDEKVVTDLVATLWQETDITKFVGKRNIDTLMRTQTQADRARIIYANRQAGLQGLTEREQVVNFVISPVRTVASDPTSLEWEATVTFRNGTQVNTGTGIQT